MVLGTVAATVAAWIIGTFLQAFVFDLEDEQLLFDAGVGGYAASLGLLALMVSPALVGIGLGLRARNLGERQLGLTGAVIDAVMATYLVATAVANLFLG